MRALDMMRLSDFVPVLTAMSSVRPAVAAKYSLDGALASSSKQPFPDAFVSYSIEFSSFPDFAGNNSNPNTFSDNLLNNIGNLTGTKPYVRVGGNTQDYALYDASLPYAINGTFDYARSSDYPTTISIGPSYFESYAQWPGVRFSHGFNLGLVGGGNSSAGWQTLLDTVPLACRALGGGGGSGSSSSSDRLYLWEYGNEPDLYSTSAQGPVRPGAPLGWNESVYVGQWLEGARQIRASLRESCPGMLGDGPSRGGFLAPSFGGVQNTLRLPSTWAAGLDADGDVELISTHNYISGANTPGITLQGTLLNHTRTAASVDAHIAEYEQIWPGGTEGAGAGPPLVMGETNSLYNQGRPGLSDSFGAALWVVDFSLYCASAGIKRVHMHMGTNYRYASWQPIQTVNATIGTKPPYYGNVAVAAFLGNTTAEPVSVASVPLSSPHEAAYAAYSAADAAPPRLLRAIVINMRGYNATTTAAAPAAAPAGGRPSRVYAFDLSGAALAPGDRVAVRRLSAGGSDAVAGVTWDGWSYDWALDAGRPVRLANVTVGEVVVVGEDHVVEVAVPDSSAAVLSFVGNGTVG